MKHHGTTRTLYRLNKPIPNPKPDKRRKNEWVCKPEFYEGLYLRLDREESYEGIERMEGKTFITSSFRRVTPGGDTYYGEIIQNRHEDGRFEALAENVVAVDIDLRDLQHTLALHPDMDPRHMVDVLSWLLRNGIVTPEQLTIAFDRVVKVLE